MLRTTCSTWPDVKRPSRPGWGAKHSPLFQKTRNIEKKIARVPPFIFVSVVSQASDIRFRHAICHSTSFFNFKKVETLKKKFARVPPYISFQLFHGRQTSFFGILYAVLHHFSRSIYIFVPLLTLPDSSPRFSKFSEILKK